jgi:microcystin-dependent protein
MADQFVAEIRMFPTNFAPRGWAMCDGQLLPISQNTALFSLLGTTYGGNGASTFALPNLQGRAPMHPGNGPGLSLYTLGEESGQESVTLLESQIPAHSHQLLAANTDATSSIPDQQVVAGGGGGVKLFGEAPAPGSSVMLATQMAAPAGGSQPHNNMMPYLTVSFCIALQGIFPPRS